MPAAASIIGRCTECCACPTPELPSSSYQSSFTSRSGSLGCIASGLSGNVSYTDITYSSLDNGITLPMTALETISASGSGIWNYYTGGSVSGSSSRTVEIPPSAPTTTTVSNSESGCGVGIAYVPQYSSPSEAGAYNYTWEYREADLIVATDPSTGIGYSRFRTYYNPTTFATQNVYGNGSSLGSPWLLIYDRERTASGSIKGYSVTGVIDGIVGTDACAITEEDGEIGVSVTVSMTVFGLPDTDYTVLITYEDNPISDPAKTDSFEVTTDEDGVAEFEFNIIQPDSGITRCIDTVEIIPHIYIVRFRIPLSYCYSASWIVTNGDSSTSVSEIWDGVIPDGYDRNNPDTWPFFGPFDFFPGDNISDLSGDCTCP